jgi:hypothetical protein
MNILQLHMDDLHSLAHALLDKETLSGEQIVEALKASKQHKAMAAAAAAQEAGSAAQEASVVVMPIPAMSMSGQAPAIKAGGASR